MTFYLIRAGKNLKTIVVGSNSVICCYFISCFIHIIQIIIMTVSLRFLFRERVTIQDLFETDSVGPTNPKTENNNVAMPISTGISSSFEMGDNNNNSSIMQPVSNATPACSINEFMAHVSDRRNVLTMWSLVHPGGHVHSPCIDGPDIDQITGYNPTVIEFLARRWVNDFDGAGIITSIRCCYCY